MAWPLVIGAGLMAAGGIASGIGSNARKGALNRLSTALQDQYNLLGKNFSGGFNPIIADYTRARGRNMQLYREEMAQAIGSYTRYFDEARTQYSEGMTRALEEMRTGRESTTALVRQDTERSLQRQRSMNAFTGLGQTSFGAGRLEAIGSQGSLREGAVREQYAAQLSALEAQRASGMSSLSAQFAQGLGSMQSSQAQNLSNIYQMYTGNITNLQQAALTGEYGYRAQGLSTAAQLQSRAAQMVGGGWAAAGSALGSIGGAVFGAGLGGAFSAPAGAAAGGQFSTFAQSPQYQQFQQAQQMAYPGASAAIGGWYGGGG